MGDSLGLSGTPRIPDVADLTISRIRRGLEAREFTCRELCDVSLALWASFLSTGLNLPLLGARSIEQELQRSTAQ